MTKGNSNGRVSEHMTPSVPVLSSRTSVGVALRLAQEHGLAALPVCEGGRFLGLVSEKDLLTLTPSKATTLSRFEMNELLDRITVGAVVKSPPVTVAHDLALREAAEIMVKTSSEVLPVLEYDRFAGLISWRDLFGAALGNCLPPGRCERDGRND